MADTSVTNGKIVKRRKANEAVTFDSSELAAVDLLMQHIMSSERQVDVGEYERPRRRSSV